MSTKIEWADETWNPITGCSPVSAGCNNCYAKRMANRLRGRHGYPADNPFNVTLHPDRLEQPFRWLKPRKVFVCSMGDLFHEDVPFGFIAKVFGIMHSAKQHIFMVLTKRPERVKEFFEWFTGSERCGTWPKEYPHVMIGVTAENQEQADKRIPVLLQIPAAVRFVSVEPMLGPVRIKTERELHEDAAGMNLDPMFFSFKGINANGIGVDWVICGGETGPGARPMHPDWARSLRDQCQAAGVPFFFKQWGGWTESEHASTHLVHVGGINRGTRYFIPRDDATTIRNAGYKGERKIREDLIDRGHPGWIRMRRVSKKIAGRLLDGREWNEYPMAEEVKS